MIVNHKEIEEKWARKWEETGFHRVDLRKARRPFYNLMMFPYPSAEGLHVGNMFAFVGSDIQGRYMRARGYDVFEPMGFDAFGMHSENYALKTGDHPWRMVPRNIRYFREKQLKKIGNIFDWSRQVNTTDPEYYRWTQWVFLQLFRAGLAYKKSSPVNWCPSCKTVLANEQARSGACERCDTGVESRLMDQWFFKITRYADRLLANLDSIDWSPVTKQAQKNWIGKSTGVEIDFPIVGSNDTVPVFTTRPDTVFGATFIAIAPDHPLAGHVLDSISGAAAATPEFSGVKNDGEKLGVKTGYRAVNPCNGEHIPIWVVNYVVSDYGSGAIMGVPAHDVRDFEFAGRYGIEVREVVRPCDNDRMEGTFFTGDGVLINSGPFNGALSGVARRRITDWIVSKGAGRPKSTFRLRDWCISRQRYWGTPIPMVYCDPCGAVPVPETDLPVLLPFIEKYEPDGSGSSPLSREPSFVHTQCPLCGGPARRETDVSDNFLDSAWYFLRYPSPTTKERPFEPELILRWLPVDLYIGGNEHAVLHLMYTRFITMALHDLGHLEFEEPFKRFRANGTIVKNGAKMSKSKGNVINPDQYIERYGADVFRTYLMFSGSYLEGGDFRDNNIVGIERFFERVWRFCTERCFGRGADIDDLRISKIHAGIRDITQDIEGLRYNTAIAKIMELFSVISTAPTCSVDEVGILLKLIAPFAPFISHELWNRLGNSGFIAAAGWPEHDESLILESKVEFVIQINGKVRDRFSARPTITEAEAKAIAFSRGRVRAYTEDREVIRSVFVPKKLLNIVVR